MKKRARPDVDDLRPEYDAVLIRDGVRGKYAKPYREGMMTSTEQLKSGKRWTAAELRNLPPVERDAILAAAAELAEQEYRTNPELTAFEAFGKGDLHGESSSTETQ